MKWAVASASMLVASAQIPPEHAENLTVYHLNPKSAGALPINMDTGDARGDLYFYLGQFLLPLECKDPDPKSRAHFDCDNPERVDPNLVVTKVDMVVDNRPTTYSACNLCNGTDPFTHKPCVKGTYVCDCFSHGHSCDGTKLGVENISDKFAPHAPEVACEQALESKCGKVKHSTTMCYACIELNQKELSKSCKSQADFQNFCPNPWASCNASSPEWSCWSENIPRKTGGFWYSTLKEGQCNASSPAGSCGWKVQSLKTVKEQCLKDVLITRVENYGQSCFSGCGPRNVSSSCWIQCFFDAILGTDARHSRDKPLAGMPIADLEKGWADAFLPKEQGGCDEVLMLDAYDSGIIV